jgi:hypothetical protein
VPKKQTQAFKLQHVRTTMSYNKHCMHAYAPMPLLSQCFASQRSWNSHNLCAISS